MTMKLVTALTTIGIPHSMIIFFISVPSRVSFPPPLALLVISTLNKIETKNPIGPVNPMSMANPALYIFANENSYCKN